MVYLVAFLLILSVIINWSWRYPIRQHLANKAMAKLWRNHPEWQRFTRLSKLLNSIYQAVDAASLSNKDRKSLHLDEDAYIYGEIEFLPFLTLLDEVKPKQGEIFYDLGAGAGRAVFAAGLAYELSKACGIELLPGLHATSVAMLEKARLLLQRQTDKGYLTRLSSIKFIQANLLDCDFSDGDIIYISATCFNYSFWEKTIAKLTSLKIGSRVMVATKKIAHEQFEFIQQSNRLMSWGLNSINIYRKIK